jgi:hypothetical protein
LWNKSKENQGYFRQSLRNTASPYGQGGSLFAVPSPAKEKKWVISVLSLAL